MRTFNEFQTIPKMLAWVQRRETGPDNFHFAIQADKGHVDYLKCRVGMRTTCETIQANANGVITIVPYSDIREWCANNGVTIERIGTQVIVSETKREYTDVIDTVEQPKQPKQQPTAVESSTDTGIVGAIDSMIRTQVGELRDEINERFDTFKPTVGLNPTIVSVQTAPDKEPIPVGLVHKSFPTLLQAMSARTRSGNRLNICLVGPAGTGKTKAAEQAATAMGLPFYPYNSIESKFEILGFRDATGNVVRTSFREACEHGGVVLFDEMSASSANARLTLNAILANRMASFPDGPMKLHADCIILGGDNVIGGATAAYNGRHKPDASSIDRWVYLDWDIDTTLERVIAGNDSWTDIVAKVRSEVERQGIRDVLITPRSSETGAALMAQGMDIKAVARMTLKKNMSEEQWAGIVSKVCELK